MSYQQHLEVIKKLNDEFRYNKTIESLFELDLWSALPPAGGAYRQQVSAYVSQQKASLFSSDEAKKAAEYFSGISLEKIDNYIEHGLIRTFLSRYNNVVNTPVELTREYNLMKADVMNAWKLAREKQDYKIFAPWLAKVFSLKKEIALAINPDQAPFDTLINMIDEGLTSEDISREFAVLKEGIVNLLNRISKSSVTFDNSVFSQQEDPEKVAEFGRKLATEAGYNTNVGGFNHRVVHAFASFLGPQDARVSTALNGNLHLMFTCLHEAGHAMYASGGSQAVNAANMWGGIEGSFQEACARFYENMVGKTEAYWQHYYPLLQQQFPRLQTVSQEDFYKALHVVKPTLRRVEADEVTYSLHVIIRFELERDLFAGLIAPEDLAEAWNAKYEEYLGVRPSNDTEGVLQDMHWAGDYIGYFQSYALGNIYDGQILQVVKKDIPDFNEQIASGKLDNINQWMKENIYQYGCCFTAGELTKRLTGTPLDAKPFLQYLEEKYSKLYNL